MSVIFGNVDRTKWVKSRNSTQMTSIYEDDLQHISCKVQGIWFIENSTYRGYRGLTLSTFYYKYIYICFCVCVCTGIRCLSISIVVAAAKSVFIFSLSGLHTTVANNAVLLLRSAAAEAGMCREHLRAVKRPYNPLRRGFDFNLEMEMSVRRARKTAPRRIECFLRK